MEYFTIVAYYIDSTPPVTACPHSSTVDATIVNVSEMLINMYKVTENLLHLHT